MKTYFSRSVLLLPIIFASSKRLVTTRSALIMSKSEHLFVVDAFAARQFNNPDYTGTQVSFSVDEFEKLVNRAYTDGAKLADGYAPFW
jgi:Protein of unknown function (DUF3228)